MQPFSCQQREYHISKRSYETLVHEIHISRLELQRWPLGFFYFHSKVNIFEIWDSGLANSFLDHVIQISIKKRNFQYIFSQHLLPIIKYLFSRNSYVFPTWIFIFDTQYIGTN
jgi:hypothetical protein